MSDSTYHVLSRMIEEQVRPDEHPGLWIDTPSGYRLLTAHEARDAVRARDDDGALRAVVWRTAVQAAKHEEADDLTRLFALWLAGPWLRRVLTVVYARFGVVHEDFEAEFAAAFLEALAQVDDRLPDLGDRLLRTATAPIWRIARQRSRFTEFTASTFPAPLEEPADPTVGLWELEILPPLSEDHLPASLRIVGSATAVEGTRIGALAGRMGLDAFVHRARRPGEGVRVGALRLRPAGAAR